LCALAGLQAEKTRRDELHREKDKLQGQVAELGGMVKSQQRLLELEKVGHSITICHHSTIAVVGLPAAAAPHDLHASWLGQMTYGCGVHEAS
jgi:hypothetical protein